MVARISTGKCITRMVNYNEKKLQQGKAELIDAVHFGKKVEALSFRNKVYWFEMLQQRNQNVKTNAVHISLNFDTSEKLEKEKLQQIASAYMEKLGFGEQPYLVYEHHDAGHPHIHIVTTNVMDNGKRINLHNIGRNQSEKARKEIELEFKLVRAESKKQQQKQTYPLELEQKRELQPVSAQRVKYGEVETKKAIANVLNTVIDSYKYTSLHELNAVLKLYNVVADRGKEDSRIYQKRGLVYRVLDDNGNKIGAPIKASAFYNKPILNNIEKKFEVNEVKRQEHRQRVRVAIDFVLVKRKQSVSELISALQKEQISTVIRQNKEGFVYGITYVDHKTKCVFNGSDLGKQYSAKGIMERCGQDLNLQPNQSLNQSLQSNLDQHQTLDQEQRIKHANEKTPGLENVLYDLLKPEQQPDYVPYQFKKKRKRNQRQSRGLQ
jgi:hypothetical protein